MIPGSDILGLALSVIDSTTASYAAPLSRTVDDEGKYVTTYAAPITIDGSLQAVPRNKYDTLGLSLQKRYIWFYTSNDLIDVGRDNTAGKLTIGSKTYNCMSATAWFEIDGWIAMLCEEIQS